ncbi:MAG: slipin family protein [Sporichthyaceae bacterium]|nr:slipin family protein [Sporichthyaceae bacterium]
MVWRVTIMEWETGVRFVDGKVRDQLQPGRHYVWPPRSQVHRVDRRPRWLVVTGQDVLTADGLSVRLSALARWRVVDAARYLTTTESAQADLHTAVQLAVRDAITAVSLDELVSARTGAFGGLAEDVRSATAGIGVEVDDVVIRDLMLPGELRLAMTQTLMAREAGRAALERARGEAAALRSLANTAKLVEDHPALLHLRTLEVAAQPGTKVILAAPGLDARDVDPG